MPANTRRVEPALDTQSDVGASGVVVPMHGSLFCEVEGRGTRGKTTLIRVLMERALDAGRPVQLIDLDARAQLRAYFEDVLSPEYPEEVAVHEFLEALVDAQTEAVAGPEPMSVMLDMNGNDPTFGKFAARLRLADLLQEHGIKPVRLRLLGPDPEDAADLARDDVRGGWTPRDTVLFLNHGTVRDGRNAEQAFAPVREHPAFRAAVDRGARVVNLPALPCMPDVVAKGYTFGRAMEPGALGASKRQLLKLWREAVAHELAAVSACLP